MAHAMIIYYSKEIPGLQVVAVTSFAGIHLDV